MSKRHTGHCVQPPHGDIKTYVNIVLTTQIVINYYDIHKFEFTLNKIINHSQYMCECAAKMLIGYVKIYVLNIFYCTFLLLLTTT